ncbi:MAG: germination protein YpeB [Clostridiales bacterium]|jgi:germination protein YpeB|nr:germination protein YpeB [Clostridiales bacterium]
MSVTQYYKKRVNAWKIVAVILAVAAIIGLSIALILTARQNRRQRDIIKNAYERSFYELSDAANNLEMSLSKLLVSYDDAHSAVLAAEVYGHSGNALSAMSRLPLTRVNAADAEKFFNQVADFCASFEKCIAYGGDPSSYRERVEDLYIAARTVNRRVLDEGAALAGDGYSVEKVMQKWNAEQPFTVSGDGGGDTSHNSVEYPELIYDGPFSDGLANREFKFLKDLPEIPCDAAIEFVKTGLPFSVSAVQKIGDCANASNAYELTAQTDAGEVYCSVSKNGGRLMNLSVYKNVAGVKIGGDEAKARAVRYAAAFGYDVAPVWYNAIDGVAIINLAHVSGGAVYYTDLVKVRVALDDGSLCGFDAGEYCMNHTDRTYEPVLTPDEATASVAKNLSVLSVRLAVVPDGRSERLCYEIAADYKGLDYFIYVDSRDGREVNIMRVIDEDQGSMVI